jgi:pyruvate,water dikinase
VPPGFVILSNAYNTFIRDSGLSKEIAALLAKVNFDDMGSIERVSDKVRSMIHDTALPHGLIEKIMAAHAALSSQYVAVRSSATAEDSSTASWAGELETYLNTTKERIGERVRDCWSSLFTPRAIFYRYEKGLIETPVSVAVVIQKMIQSEISGVAFTVHPVTEDHNQMIIEAALGLGEAIVGGFVTPDSYVITKNDLDILDIAVGEQTRMLLRSNKMEHGEQNEWVELGFEGSKQKLTEQQIVELASICKKIEEHYGFPCDIEWAFADDAFYITQSRPITTLK